MKFKIENRTQYSTRCLRSFVVRSYAVAKQFSGGRAVTFERWCHTMTVRFARANHRGKRGTTGHAYLRTGFAHIGVGDDVDPLQLAYVIAHEFAHCFGMQHSDMSGSALMRSDHEIDARFYPWAATLPIYKQTPKQKPTGEARAALKRVALTERLERWQSKQARAERAVKKLRASLRDFDRRQERKAALPKVQP